MGEPRRPDPSATRFDEQQLRGFVSKPQRADRAEEVAVDLVGERRMADHLELGEIGAVVDGAAGSDLVGGQQTPGQDGKEAVEFE